MDKVSLYMGMLSPGVVAAVVTGAILAFALVPRVQRLYVSVAIMVIWTMISQMPELPGPEIAKPTIAVTYVMVGLAALLHPGPKLRLPAGVLWWPILGLFAVIFVLYVDNVVFAIVIRIQWVILVISAILLCRTITTRESADALARAIGVGLMIGVAIAATAILTQGRKAFHLGRLDPYGANSNQLGVIFAVAVPFSLYCAVRAQRKITRWVSALMTAVAATLLVITASRSSVVVAAICVIPFLLSGIRRAALLLSMVAVAMVVIIPFAYSPETSGKVEVDDRTGLTRLSSIDTPRYEIFTRYINESISKRPFTGLLGQSESSVLRDSEIGIHPHNAYLEMMYLGGIVYALPMLFLAFVTLASAVYVVRRRKYTTMDPLLTSLLCALLFAVYAHGFVNGSIYYPTSSWAYFHVLASCFMLAAAAQLRRSFRAARIEARRRQVVPVCAVLLLLMTAACCGGRDGTSAQGTKPAGDSVNSGGDAPARPASDATTDRDDDDMDETGTTAHAIDDITHLDIDTSAATPEVICAVKLDTANEGPEVRKQARALKVPMLMIAYNWVVDVRKDGRFDKEDQARFARWIDTNIRPDSNQLVAIDYEKPYWPELRNSRQTPPERIAEIAKVYREIYDFAKARRSKARWGFYGLPMRNYRMAEPWKERIRQLGEHILRHTDVVYLSIYDNHAGDNNGRDLEAMRMYAELTLAEARGRPVYAFARGRYASKPDRDEPIPDDEFRANIEAALDGRWNDGKREHRLAGVILWDGKKDKRPRPFSPQELDKLYAKHLKIITETVRRRRARAAGSP